MDGAGKPKINFGEIYARVDENRRRLDACPRHLFNALPLDQVAFGGKIECKNCGGKLELLAVNQYIRGYEAAGRSGNDILPGWKDVDDPNAPPKRKHFTTSFED